MTSNSCLRCDLKESWLWGRNGPSCGFISNSFFKCLPLDLSLSVLPPLLVLLWLLVCLHFSFPLFLDFLSPDFCCVCILDISSSLKLHFYCSICSLPWPLIKKKKGNQQKLNPRTATSYNVCKIQFQVRRETAATRWDTSDRNVGLNSTNSIYLTLDTQEPLLDNGAVNQ